MNHHGITFYWLVIIITIQATPLAAQIRIMDLTGAWERGTDLRMTKIVAGQHFAVAIYDVKDKKFVGAAGGKWKLDGKHLAETFEFHSLNPGMVGKETVTPIELKNNQLNLMVSDQKEEWTKIDDGSPGELSGAWLITGKMDNDQMRVMTPGARRTMKILSGTRFQWIAYNIETKEFSGTGGGTYTTENGKYTENILFFSRDNNRVGSKLQFDFSLEDGNWRHKGMSSNGNPINEVWTKREKIGL